MLGVARPWLGITVTLCGALITIAPVPSIFTLILFGVTATMVPLVTTPKISARSSTLSPIDGDGGLCGCGSSSFVESDRFVRWLMFANRSDTRDRLRAMSASSWLSTSLAAPELMQKLGGSLVT